MIAIEIIAELGPEHARIHALENGDNSFERNFADVLVMPDSLLQFSRGGKKEDVRRSYCDAWRQVDSELSREAPPGRSPGFHPQVGQHERNPVVIQR